MKIKMDKMFSQRLLRGKTDKTFIQFFRYFLVGGFSFMIDFSILFALTEYFNFHYLISAGVGFICGLFTNYFLSIRWVFVTRTISNKMLEFWCFVLIGVIGLFLNELLLWLFTDVVSINYLFSKVITASLILFWNFFMRKILLFSRKPVYE